MWADIDKRTRESAPFQSYGAVHRVRAARHLRLLAGARDVEPRIPASPAPPGSVVVVSTTHDPATPYEAGVNLARQLGAPLITFDGTQHTAVFNGDECVDSAIVRLLRRSGGSAGRPALLIVAGVSSQRVTRN